MQATEEQIKPNPNPNPNPNPHQVTEEQVKLLMRAERGERRAAAVEEEMTEMVRLGLELGVRLGARVQ